MTERCLASSALLSGAARRNVTLSGNSGRHTPASPGGGRAARPTLPPRRRGAFTNARSAFTLIELLVVIAIIAILAAILFPVFAAARSKARQAVCASNVRQVLSAALMYAQDFDGTFPRHDNNGSCIYGEAACSLPDHGDLTVPAGVSMEDADVGFFGVIQPYLRSRGIGYCPEIGASDWEQIVAGGYGINWGGPYDPARIPVYESLMGQMAVTAYAIDYGTSGYPDTLNRQLALGVQDAIARPAECVLFVAESAWGWSGEQDLGLGNGNVWPNMPGTPCDDDWTEGWSFYVHAGGRGNYPTKAADRATNNPNMKGFATFGFADGHAKAMKFAEAEKCRYDTARNVYYYPYWETRW